jgi:hypothetical protein
MITNHKHYYAAQCFMSVNYTYDSPCWTLYAFDCKQDRDEWLYENKYRDGNIIAEAVDYKTARKIAPELRHESLDNAWRVIHVYQVVDDQKEEHGKWSYD